jgi:lysophospholipase L1-like esterase
LVYISEAHPVRKSNNPDKPKSPKDITQAKSAKERIIAADSCMKGLKFTMPILIDLPPEGKKGSMVGVVERAYRGRPAATVIVDLDGKIAFYSRGPRGVQPKKADDVLKKLIAKGGFPTKKPSRWEKNIKRFEARDKTNPPPKDKILFLGSSSIVRWKTDALFPNHTTINRGFGGSQISDSLEFADRILLPYQPRTVVFYAGDNDVASGESSQQVVDDYKALVTKTHAALPKTKFVFVAIKPSLARWNIWPKMKQANEAIAAFSKSDPRLEYLDIATPMLGADGKPKRELLSKDRLHLSAEGYRLWTSLTLPLIGKPDK